MIFLDTSGVYATADVAHPAHAQAVALMERAIEAGEPLLMHNYLVSEALSVFQRRLGMGAALAFLDGIDNYQVHWITREEHDDAVALFRERGRRRLSLVDCASFVVMRRYGVTEGLFFDAGFEREGFRLYGGA